MGWKDLGVSYEALLGLGMTTDVELLNCAGHVSRVMHALAILTMFFRQTLSVTTGLRCLQEMWSRPGVDDDKYLAIASLNSCLEKGGHSTSLHLGILFRRVRLTGRLAAELYDEWRASHSKVRELHGRPS